MNTKLTFTLVLGAAVHLSAAAQTGKAMAPHLSSQAALVAVATPPAAAVASRADALTANMAQALSLTPAQTEKVRAVNTVAVRNVEEARLRYRQEPTKLREYIGEVGLARLDRLKEILTPAQFTRYQQKREEKMGIPTAHGTQGTPPPGLGSNRGEDN